MDTRLLCPPDMDVFNVVRRTHHRQRIFNALQRDGSVRSLNNRMGQYTVDLRDYAELHDACGKSLEVFERADAAP